MSCNKILTFWEFSNNIRFRVLESFREVFSIFYNATQPYPFDKFNEFRTKPAFTFIQLIELNILRFHKLISNWKNYKPRWSLDTSEKVAMVSGAVYLVQHTLLWCEPNLTSTLRHGQTLLRATFIPFGQSGGLHAKSGARKSSEVSRAAPPAVLQIPVCSSRSFTSSLERHCRAI